MEATLNAVGQLIIQALPTFFIVVLLHFYLKHVFFVPLARTLAERSAATEGARQSAAAALAAADAKASEYEERIRAARNEIYKEQEEQRRKWRTEQSAQITEARKSAEAQVAEGKSKLGAQAEAAKRSLESEVQALAKSITRSILQGRAA